MTAAESGTAGGCATTAAVHASRDGAWWWLLLGLLTVAAAGLAFQPALRNTLTHDDIHQVTYWSVPTDVGDLVRGTFAPWWPPDRGKHLWRPVTRLSILAQKVFVAAPEAEGAWVPLYGFNIGAHAAVALLLLVAARRWRMALGPAAIGALIFAVHPIHAEAVHQVVGRAELLAAFWMLVGLILWTRWGAFSSHAWWQQSLVYALALGSKEHAVLYPFYLALASVAGPVGLLPGSGGWVRWRQTGQWRRLPGLAAVLLGVLVVFLVAKYFVTGGMLEPRASAPMSENPLAHMAFAERLPASLGVLGYALVHLVWPLGIAPDFAAISLPFDAGWQWPYAWVGAAGLVALFVAGVVNGWRGGRSWALIAGGGAAWLLTSNLPMPIGAAAGQRLWYWPSVAACFGLGWAIYRVTVRLAPEAARGRMLTLVTLLVVSVLLGVAWRDAGAWRSQLAFADATLDHFPDSWRANVNLAREAYAAKDFEVGREHARRAVAVFPDEPVGWGVLGLNAMFLPDGREEAEAAFRRALELDPTSTITQHNLDNLLRMPPTLAEETTVVPEAPVELPAAAQESTES